MVHENNPEFECLQIYKTTLKTDKGDCDVEYRNSSNGYYGGSLDLTHLSEKQMSKMTKVEKDF